MGSEDAQARSGRLCRTGPVKFKQLYLDLGQVRDTCCQIDVYHTGALVADSCAAQRDFGHATCVECGMLFAKGDPVDERMHATFHAASVAATPFRVRCIDCS